MSNNHIKLKIEYTVKRTYTAIIDTKECEEKEDAKKYEALVNSTNADSYILDELACFTQEAKPQNEVIEIERVSIIKKGGDLCF